jgi:amidase
MSPIGLGNDIGGSVRNPAYCCGITSLKPSAGRIPHASSIPPTESGLSSQLMLVEGPMARHVKDLKLAYEILSGRDIRDPVSADVPLYGSTPANRCATLVTNIPGVELPQQHIDAIRQAGDFLSRKGWDIVEEQPPELERVTEVWGHTLAADLEYGQEELALIMSEPAMNIIRQLCSIYPLSAMPLPTVHRERWRLSCAWSAFFEDHPVVIGPTWTTEPFPHGYDVSDDAGEKLVNVLKFITPANVLGLPAACVPLGTSNGLPTGVQIVADRWREDLVLDAAATIEAETGQITPIDPTF